MNSLWGRFALRNHLAHSEITDDPARYIEILDDYKIEVTGVEQLNEECIMVTYEPVDEYMVENQSSNLVTRLKYKSMQIFIIGHKFNDNFSCSLPFI